ncbi:toll/interleukin-1 receptor domain-containing protein [Brevundimonas phoenicis]|uniref:toll/interleukin-1 receptor domain-containing protein n=1 Tax=unclassified Brevundimonas TaxID=2622653 RepID=UPI0039A2DAE2
MKIFISWSGQRSQAMAVALRDWLPLVLHYAEPWLSTADIKSGDRWGNEIAKGLQDSNFGIICVTRDNLEAPWLLFESGALAKSMEDGRVIPLRLDIDVSDISGPLTQFQSEKADDEGVKRLISSLNKCAANAIADDRLNRLFEPMWPDLKAKIDAIPASGTAQKRARPQAEILEELVAGVRSVEMRVRDISDEEPRIQRKYRRRIHPGMMMELSHRISQGPNDPIQILIFASLFREEIPWLYELACDTYRTIREGNHVAAQRSAERFRETILLLRHGPFMEMIGSDSKMMHMMLSDALEFMPLIHEIADSSPKTKGRNDAKVSAA